MAKFLVASLTLVLAAAMLGSALAADQNPAWDPSVGYNPEQLDAAAAKAREEAPKGFAPTVAGPGAATGARPTAPTAAKPGATAWPAPEGWRPYQHPHPTGN